MSQKRPDVQGLRALAVTVVVLDHAGVPWLAGGFIGVDVFFVVSGFLITSLLVREVEINGHVRIAAFYARRARRILPAATVVLVATTMYAAGALSTVQAERVQDDTVWSAFFVANLHFASSGTDYFAQGQEPSPLQHFWSLAVEEQFYLVFPGLLAAIALLARRRWRPALAVVIVLVCASSFVWSVVLDARSPLVAYFSAPARAWELGAGALVALTARQRFLPARSSAALAVVGLLAVLAPAVVLDGSESYASWQLAVPVLGTALVIAAGAGARSGPGIVLGLRPVQWVGDISYSLYLWHWPVLVLGKDRAGGAVTLLEATGLVVLSVVLAAASYYLVENPFRGSSRLWAGARRGLLLWPLALVATLLSTSWSAGMVSAAEQTERTKAERFYRDHEVDLPEVLGPVTLEDRIDHALELARSRAPVPSLRNLDRLGHDLWNAVFDCHAGYVDTTAQVCPLGDRNAERTVVALGDSHMGMWLPGLDLIGRREHFRLVPFIKYSCPPYDVPMAIKEVGGDYTQCDEFRDFALDQIEALRPAAVILGVRGLGAGLSDASLEERARAWAPGVLASLESFVEQVGRVKVLADIPEQPREPADCLTVRSPRLSACDFGFNERVRLANALLQRAALRTGADYVDVTSLLCLEGRCPAVVGRVVTYADNDHVSASWAEEIEEELGELLALSPETNSERPRA